MGILSEKLYSICFQIVDVWRFKPFPLFSANPLQVPFFHKYLCLPRLLFIQRVKFNIMLQHLDDMETFEVCCNISSSLSVKCPHLCEYCIGCYTCTGGESGIYQNCVFPVVSASQTSWWLWVSYICSGLFTDINQSSGKAWLCIHPIRRSNTGKHHKKGMDTVCMRLNP